MKQSLCALLSAGLLCGGAVSAAGVRPPAPCYPIPEAKQIRLQNVEYAGFVHFNMGTFTEDEHCASNYDPKHFNPTQLDCGQWARTAKAAGMKMLILTAKHHDGFCLWDSKVTEYDVGSSSWRGGKGDVVREFTEACRKEGLIAGIYISPSDNRHGSGPSKAYKDFMNAQLEEIFGGTYGDFLELWWDGFGASNIPVESRQSWIDTVRRLQPGCNLRQGFGPDFRWGGSERASVNYPQWTISDYGKNCDSLSRTGRIFDPGERHCGSPDGSDWMPAEADPPAGNAWFWHSYYRAPVAGPTSMEGFSTTVWRNANLLRGLAPDRTGRIPEAMVNYLVACRKNRDRFYASKVPGGTAVASETRGNAPEYGAAGLMDGNHATYWAPDDGRISGLTLTVSYPAPVTVGSVMLGEYFELGQRVKAFRVEAKKNGAWETVFKGQTIGRKQICSFGRPFETDALRVRIDDARACPLISDLTVYGMTAESEIGRMRRPQRPTALRAFPTENGTVRVTWKDDPAAVTSYELEVNGQVLPGVSYPYTQTETVPGKTYTYRLRGGNMAGTSPWTGKVSARLAPPDVPAGLQVIDPVRGSSALIWTPSVGAASYEIFCGDRVIGTTEGCRFTLPKDGKPGPFAVRAVNPLGKSPLSTTVVPERNLACGCAVTATLWNGNAAYTPERAVDGNSATRWAVGVKQPTRAALTVSLGRTETVGRAVIEEYTEQGRSRITAYTLDAFVGGHWVSVVKGKRIGERAVLKFKPVQTDRMRLSVLSSEPGPSVRELRLYRK